MGITVVKGGLGPDVDCLHCTVAQVTSDYIDAHPEERGSVSPMIALAQVIGELGGSGLYNSRQRHHLEAFAEGIKRKVIESAQELFETMDHHRKG